jgi:hypothetical protein
MRGSSILDRNRLYGAPRQTSVHGPTDPVLPTPASRGLEPLGPPPRASEIRCSPRVFAALIAVVLLLGVGGLRAALDVDRPGSSEASPPGATFPVAAPPAEPDTSPSPTSMPTGTTSKPAVTTTATVVTPPTTTARSAQPQRPTATSSPPKPSASSPVTRPTTGTCQYSISFEPTQSGDYFATIVVTNTTPETVQNRQGARGVNAVDQMMKDWSPTMNWPDDYEIRRENGMTLRLVTATQARSELSGLVQEWLVCG